MKEFNDSDIYKLSLEIDDVKLKLEKEEPVQPIVAAHSAVMPAAVSAAPTAVPTAAPVVSTSEQQEGTPVKSPVVGVFTVPVHLMLRLMYKWEIEFKKAKHCVLLKQ